MKQDPPLSFPLLIFISQNYETMEVKNKKNHSHETTTSSSNTLLQKVYQFRGSFASAKPSKRTPPEDDASFIKSNWRWGTGFKIHERNVALWGKPHEPTALIADALCRDATEKNWTSVYMCSYVTSIIHCAPVATMLLVEFTIVLWFHPQVVQVCKR